jgi:large subunit ribosomal protein L17
VRHRKARTKLTGPGTHRRAIYANQLAAIIERGRIKTTERKAKDLRGVVERAVTRFTRLGDILTKDPAKLDVEERARLVHAMRMVRRTLNAKGRSDGSNTPSRERSVVMRLFDEWAPRYLGRPGGYTRILKVGPRKGDGAPMAIIEFVPAEMPQRAGRDEGSSAKGAKQSA